MKGHMQEGKFHPHTNYKHVRNKSDTSKTQGIIIRKQRERPVEWETAWKRYNDFVKDTRLTGFTFDPTENIAYDFDNQKQTKKFHQKYVRPKGSTNMVYVVGRTNNIVNEITNVPERFLQSEYETTIANHHKPFFGGFIDLITDEKFTDISFVISGISEEEVIAMAKNLAQKSVTRISVSGKFTIVDTNLPETPKTGIAPV